MKNILIILIFCYSGLFSQSTKNQPSLFNFDSANLAIADTGMLKTEENSSDEVNGKIESKSKISALWRSLIVPGWGQYYQEKPVQTLLYPTLAFAGVIGSIFTIDQYNKAVNEYNDARNLYLKAYNSSEINALRNTMDEKFDDMESREKTRNILLIATGAVWLWNVLDTVILPPGYESSVNVSSSSQNDRILLGMNISL